MQEKHLIQSIHVYDKNSQQSGFRGNKPKHNGSHIQQTHCQRHTPRATTVSFFLEAVNKTGTFAFTSLIQIVLEILATEVRKDIKGIQTGKQR